MQSAAAVKAPRTKKQAQVSKTPRAQPVAWSPGATDKDSWKDLYVNHTKRGNLYAKHWSQIQEEINARGDGTRTRYTAEQVRAKVDTLKKKYKSEFAQANGTGQKPSTWEYFDKMAEIIGSNPKQAGIPGAIDAGTLVGIDPDSILDSAATAGDLLGDSELARELVGDIEDEEQDTDHFLDDGDPPSAQGSGSASLPRTPVAALSNSGANIDVSTPETPRDEDRDSDLQVLEGQPSQSKDGGDKKAGKGAGGSTAKKGKRKLEEGDEVKGDKGSASGGATASGFPAGVKGQAVGNKKPKLINSPLNKVAASLERFAEVWAGVKKTELESEERRRKLQLDTTVRLAEMQNQQNLAIAVAFRQAEANNNNHHVTNQSNPNTDTCKN